MHDQRIRNKFGLEHLKLEVLQEFGGEDENNDPIGVKGDQRTLNGRKKPKRHVCYANRLKALQLY